MDKLSFFPELVMQTDEGRRGFETHDVVVDAVANGMSLERYQRFLLELYHVVYHFNPVSAAAASRIGDQHRQIRYFLYEHMQEESGHEVWVRNDLEAVGVEASAFSAHQPSVHTLALTGYNYWCADRRHPLSALGMIYALEVIASVYGGPFATTMRECLFLSGDRGVSFIDSHGTLDSDHMAKLRVVLNTVTHSDAQAAIVESTLVNFDLFTKIFAGV